MRKLIKMPVILQRNTMAQNSQLIEGTQFRTVSTPIRRYNWSYDFILFVVNGRFNFDALVFLSDVTREILILIWVQC